MPPTPATDHGLDHVVVVAVADVVLERSLVRLRHVVPIRLVQVFEQTLHDREVDHLLEFGLFSFL